MGTLESQICKILSDEHALDPGVVGASSNVRELPGMESIKVLRAVTKIEKQFEIELDDSVVFQVETVAELAGAVQERLGANGAS